MEERTQETVKRLLIRLEDARLEVQTLKGKVDYPMTAKFERAYDAIESAERFLKDTLG